MTTEATIGTDEALDFSAVASQLAELSRDGTLPEGQTDQGSQKAAPFSAGEVDFLSNDWLMRVVMVQPWLGLDSPLNGDESAAKLAQQLFSELSYQLAEPCFTVSPGGTVVLNERGLSHLEQRLSRAVEYRELFEELLEEGKTKEANSQWRENWDEAGSQARQPFGRISAKVEAWKIKSFRGHADENLLDLNPSYQRDFVWSLAESQELITSILRGIPLPSVILMQGEDDDIWHIVDGKQRLTSILRFIGRHPEGRTHAKKCEGFSLFDTDFRKFVKANSFTQRDLTEHFLPFRLARYDAGDPLAPLSGKYYSEIQSKTVEIGGEKIKISKLFESEATNYLIPVILYSKTSLQNIRRVFSLYNSQGRKLNAEELRNAGFHHLALTRLFLVLSGDRADDASVDAMVPFMPPELRKRNPEVGKILGELGFGTSRFKRTKVLSWATALMFHKPNEQNDNLSTPSTAMQIDAMLEDISTRGEGHPLYSTAQLKTFSQIWQDAIIAHNDAADAWDPKFRNRRGIGSKWEELPVVASLITAFLVVVAEATSSLLDRTDTLRELTKTLPGPAKTQNKTQWQYVAKVVTKLLSAMEVDEAKLGTVLDQRFKYNCLTTFHKLAK
ncbi:MAG: DUF262 domain-containing protein [Candidatus Hydrogenedentes bacterium]|nr:DUF262 domain-containing protein [Candidatus Hydrogenedentota bacterium]